MLWPIQELNIDNQLSQNERLDPRCRRILQLMECHYPYRYGPDLHLRRFYVVMCVWSPPLQGNLISLEYTKRIQLLQSFVVSFHYLFLIEQVKSPNF